MPEEQGSVARTDGETLSRIREGMDNAKIEALNERFGMPGLAQIVAGNGGLPKIHITSPSAAAEIYVYGAHLTSWIPAGHDEVIFVSGKSHWADGNAIRGGIPVCFPWFRAKADDPSAPSHGFVRTKEWNVDSVSTGPDDSVRIGFSTESDESTRRWWPFDFRLDYRITVGLNLRLELEMRNKGQSALRFEEALHSYFVVGDVERVSVNGLDGVAYLDNRDGNREKRQSGDLRIAGATDNAYANATGPLEIEDPVLNRTLRTTKWNSAATIVWNPWREGAAALADLGDEEWRRMLCVEGGNILNAGVKLQPGAIHTMAIELNVGRDAGR